MSVYGVFFNCYIRGSKENIKKIATISQEIFDAHQDSYYESINKRIQKEYQRVNQDRNDICVISLNFDSDDCSHGVFGDFMAAFQEGVEEIEFAVKAKHPVEFEDFDPMECDGDPFDTLTAYAYKSPDSTSEKVNFGNSKDYYSESDGFYMMSSSARIFPNGADWIPWA